MAWMPLRSRPSASNARTATSSANVESSPPDTPTTTVRPWTACSRVFKAHALDAGDFLQPLTRLRAEGHKGQGFQRPHQRQGRIMCRSKA